jgi:hypothetical protein
LAALRHILYRRAIRIYLLAIVAPALVLLYLGLKSVQRQHDAINALLVSNLRLSGEKLAAELEHRTQRMPCWPIPRSAPGWQTRRSRVRKSRMRLQ